MTTPKSCGDCRYGNTYDMSVDDLTSFCAILGYSQDWCDFPAREDQTHRFKMCPLPNPTQSQIKRGKELLALHKKKKSTIKRAIHAKSFRIRKKNMKELRDICAVDTGYVPWRWFR